jgi:hypothetical protein
MSNMSKSKPFNTPDEYYSVLVTELCVAAAKNAAAASSLSSLLAKEMLDANLDTDEGKSAALDIYKEVLSNLDDDTIAKFSKSIIEGAVKKIRSDYIGGHRKDESKNK